MKWAIIILMVLFCLAISGCAGHDRALRHRQWLDDVEACMQKSEDFGHDCSLAEPK